MESNTVQVWQCDGESEVHVLFDNAHGMYLEDYEARYLCKLLEHLESGPPEPQPGDPDWIRVELPSIHSDRTHISIETNSAWHEVTFDVAESLRDQLASIWK